MREKYSNDKTDPQGVTAHLGVGVNAFTNWKKSLDEKKNRSMNSVFKFVMSVLLRIISLLIYIIERSSDLFVKWFHVCITKSSVFGQLLQRAKQIESLLKGLKDGNITLRFFNTLTAVILDVAVGIGLMYLIQKYLTIEQLFNIFMALTQNVMAHLKFLLQWLMGVPAGLKLNFPLITALGNFFLYHIHLWQTYILIVRPLLEAMLRAMFSLGYLGFTLHLSMLNDLFSLATLHVYCFYVYAARLYNLQLSGILSLSRLFRGKKWNVLRQRVDSCSYDVDQLFLGTLLFTVLLFLFPTTALCYVVFTLLRLALLFLQAVLTLSVRQLSVCPSAVCCLSVLRPSLLAGEVRFSVREPFCLTLQPAPSPLHDVIQSTKPEYFIEHKSQVDRNLFYSLTSGELV